MPDILFETSRFNLTKVKEHFINDCCFGEDLAGWLRGKLAERGIDADEPGQEDWGWYLGVSHADNTYFVGIGGNPLENGNDENYGEWRIMVEKKTSLWKKLTGKNVLAEDDPLLTRLQEMLQAEADFQNVHQE